jgi:hypothetical protein
MVTFDTDFGEDYHARRGFRGTSDCPLRSDGRLRDGLRQAVGI